MKKVLSLFFSASSLLFNTCIAEVNVLMDSIYIDKEKSITKQYDDFASDFQKIKIIQQNKKDLIKEAAIAASASYNDTDIVSLKSWSVRAQSGNPERELLAAHKDLISFSASVPRYGHMPAGIITYDEDARGKGKMIIAFHGTECAADLMTDAWAFKKYGKDLGINGYIHGGFLDRYTQSRDAMHDVIAALLAAHNKQANDIDFLVTGHSLGGALATLAAADIKNHIAKEESKVDLVTFSSPRVVDHKGAAHVEDILEGRAIRIWRAQDPISMVSIGTQFGFGFITGFKHVGKSVKLAFAEKGISMENHAHALHLKDAISEEEVSILPHEGWRSWLSRKTSKVTSRILTIVKKPFYL